MSTPLLDPSAIARLANLQLKAQAVVEGFLTGLHQSPYHGFSVEFAQHRPYMPGDSLRHLDYKVLGKTGRYFIKQFEEETNLKAYLLVDHSGSMGFGGAQELKTKGRATPPTPPSIEGGDFRPFLKWDSPPSIEGGVGGVVPSTAGGGVISKLDYASCLAAALSLLLLRQRDAVGMVTFAESLTGILPPKSAMGWLEPLSAQLQNLIPTGKTNIASALFDIAERVKRRGLVVLMSDLLDDPDQILAAMRAIRHVGHDLLVFHILDPLEVSFDFPRDARFQDLESGASITSRPAHIKASYRREMARVIDHYRFHCRASNIDYRLFTTDVPYEVGLFEFLSRRKLLK